MNNQNVNFNIGSVQTALKNYRDSIGKPTDRHHYMNEARLIRYAISGRSQVVGDIKPVTRAQRKLFKRVIDMNRQLISEGFNYQLRKLVCREIAENQKNKSAT